MASSIFIDSSFELDREMFWAGFGCSRLFVLLRRLLACWFWLVEFIGLLLLLLLLLLLIVLLFLLFASLLLFCCRLFLWLLNICGKFTSSFSIVKDSRKSLISLGVIICDALCCNDLQYMVRLLKMFFKSRRNVRFFYINYASTARLWFIWILYFWLVHFFLRCLLVTPFIFFFTSSPSFFSIVRTLF